MPVFLHSLLKPLNIAAGLTLAAVALSIRQTPAAGEPLTWIVLAIFTLALLADDLAPLRPTRHQVALLALEAVCALALCLIAPRSGTSPVLLVILAAQVSMLFGLKPAFISMLVLNTGLYLILRHTGHPAPLVGTLIYAGFQGFAVLIGHYARNAERSRDALALVNADLLATRALLADAVRDAERLRVARELHDVAGHTLTALNLNLRALATEPDLAKRDELLQAQRLSAELLAEIRGVVQALRDSRGLDLATALHALAAPLPTTRLQLHMAATARVDRIETADIVLRTAQEALTNAARHGSARNVFVTLLRDGDRLRLGIEDDGRLRGALHPGNGLTGMRERIEDHGGTLTLSTTRGGGLRIDAELPA